MLINLLYSLNERNVFSSQCARLMFFPIAQFIDHGRGCRDITTRFPLSSHNIGCSGTAFLKWDQYLSVIKFCYLYINSFIIFVVYIVYLSIYNDLPEFFFVKCYQESLAVLLVFISRRVDLRLLIWQNGMDQCPNSSVEYNKQIRIFVFTFLNFNEWVFADVLLSSRYLSQYAIVISWW